MTLDDDVRQDVQRIVRLLTIMVTKDLGQQKDKIALLSSVGFQPIDIAELIDTTPHTVNVTLSSMRKGNRRSKRAKNPKTP